MTKRNGGSGDENVKSLKFSKSFALKPKVKTVAYALKFNNCYPLSLPARTFLSQCYFYNVFLQKSCTVSLETLTKFEAAKTGSGVGYCTTLKQGTANENAADVGSSKGSDQRENDK